MWFFGVWSFKNNSGTKDERRDKRENSCWGGGTVSNPVWLWRVDPNQKGIIIPARYAITVSLCLFSSSESRPTRLIQRDVRGAAYSGIAGGSDQNPHQSTPVPTCPHQSTPGRGLDSQLSMQSSVWLAAKTDMLFQWEYFNADEVELFKWKIKRIINTIL